MSDWSIHLDFLLLIYFLPTENLRRGFGCFHPTAAPWLLRLIPAFGQLLAQEAHLRCGKLLYTIVREQQEAQQIHKNGRERKKAALGFGCSAITAKSKKLLVSLNTVQEKVIREAQVENSACRTSMAHSLLSQCPNPCDIFPTMNSSRPQSGLNNFCLQKHFTFTEWMLLKWAECTDL